MKQTKHVCSLWQSPFILKNGVNKLHGVELAAISCKSIFLVQLVYIKPHKCSKAFYLY